MAAMDILRISSIPSLQIPATKFEKTESKKLNFSGFNSLPSSSSFFLVQRSRSSTCKLLTALSSSVSTEPANPPEPVLETPTQEEKFDWYAQWYPLMPVCDLDKRVPHAKKVLGIDVVVWWDRNESSWKVFDDRCPHRLAPLSEGRIDQWGRLQCVYHGWCFNGSGDCKLIPQAHPDGPPIHKSKKACVAAYPTIVQNGIVWFWPNSDPQYKDILAEKKPPFIPELDDPSYTFLMSFRDIPYGYEVLIENLMDPAHVPYAHYGIMQTVQPREKPDREGGRPLDFRVEKLDINGFVAKHEWDHSKFLAPCVFVSPPLVPVDQDNGDASPTGTKEVPSTQRRALLIFFCIPVSPGNSRLIWTFPRNFGVWMDKIIPRWIIHMALNLVLDSDLYLLHVEEHKIFDAGPTQWQKACFVPTKADALVIGFRKWLNKYSGGQVDWRGKFSGALPPTPPREQLLDRYSSHVLSCSSCSAAYKGLKVLQVALQVVSFALLGIVAATKQDSLSEAARTAIVATAIFSFAASKWLAHFIYKQFHFHDYNHALQ